MKLKQSHIETAAEIFKEIDMLKDLLNTLAVAKDNPNAPRGINARIVIATFSKARCNPFDSERLNIPERMALCTIIEQFERARLSRRLERAFAKLDEIGVETPAKHPFAI